MSRRSKSNHRRLAPNSPPPCIVPLVGKNDELELMTVYTSVRGNNADLIRAVGRLYFRDGNRMADVTYGQGGFWNKINTARYEFFPTDLNPVPPAKFADLRDLPYPDAWLDDLFLDLPYCHNPGSHITEERYNKDTVAKNMDHADILALYFTGMQEGFRTLKPGGRLYVKCKDEVQGGIQYWTHIELFLLAMQLGLYGRDLFVLTPTSRTSSARWNNQYHGRKDHSYMWVFEKVIKPKRNRSPIIFPTLEVFNKFYQGFHQPR